METGEGELSGTLVALVERRREEIVAAFFARLRHDRSPLFEDTAIREQVAAHAEQIIDDVLARLSPDPTHPPPGGDALATAIGAARAERGIHPVVSLRAAGSLFHSFLAVLTEELASRENGLEELSRAVAAVDLSLQHRIRESAAGYAVSLLQNIHRAHVGERRRIARELHDRVGHSINAAYRYLELFDLFQDGDPGRAAGTVDRAVDALQEGLESIRAMLGELRRDAPLESLRAAISGYLDTMAPAPPRTRLQVVGDERWVPPVLRDEVFLVIREALRNAFTHAKATEILVRLEISQHWLRAVVRDDGVGVNLDLLTGQATGLTAMKERAALLGGRLILRSEPEDGTAVELIVPLPGLALTGPVLSGSALGGDPSRPGEHDDHLGPL